VSGAIGGLLYAQRAVRARTVPGMGLASPDNPDDALRKQLHLELPLHVDAEPLPKRRARSNSNNTRLDVDYRFKVVVLGDSGAGKTCVMRQFTEGQFAADAPSTLGVDYGSRVFELRDNTLVHLSPRARMPITLLAEVWDTAGQERYRSITTSYYRGCAGVLIVYDVTDRHSFDSVASWYREATHYAPGNAVIALFGNKADLSSERHAVSVAEGASLADAHGMAFGTGSAKADAASVDAAFGRLLLAAVERHERNIVIVPSPSEKRTPRRAERCAC
jgi:small GTP-binding protein